MEDFAYPSGLLKGQKRGKRIEGPFPNQEKTLTLNECLQEEWKFLNEDQIKKAYCHDLKNAIESDSIKEIIQKIFEIENNLHQLSEKVEDDKEIQIPHLEEFYKNLTPIFLRSLLEMPDKKEDQSNEIFKGWIEALRISVEEEIYFIQENQNSEN